MTRIPINRAYEQSQDIKDRLEMSTAEIGLAVRTTNCLEERGVFTVNGAGGGQLNGGSADAFHFVYQPLSGSGSIVARVVSVPSGAQAAVMIRQS